jgi:outer membrane protein
MNLTRLKVGSTATAIAIVSILAACGNKDVKTDAGTTKTTTSIASENEKIVYVNSDSLITNYEYAKAVKAKIESKTKIAESDFTTRQQAVQREYQQYQAQANSLSADQRAATEQRLERKGQELRAYQQNAGAALQNENAKENEALYNKVTEYLKSYSKIKGFKMVLTYSKGSSAILFADESLDVTSEVIKGLNELYAKEKK